MADTIEIKTELIPYTTKMKFSNGTFKFKFRYNSNSDSIIVDLLTENDAVIQENEKMIYGIPLFWAMLEDLQGNLNPNYPDAYLVPLASDGVERSPGIENINDTIFLTILERTALEPEFDFDSWRT